MQKKHKSAIARKVIFAGSGFYGMNIYGLEKMNTLSFLLSLSVCLLWTRIEGKLSLSLSLSLSLPPHIGLVMLSLSHTHYIALLV